MLSKKQCRVPDMTGQRMLDQPQACTVLTQLHGVHRADLHGREGPRRTAPFLRPWGSFALGANTFVSNAGSGQARPPTVLHAADPSQGRTFNKSEGKPANWVWDAQTAAKPGMNHETVRKCLILKCYVQFLWTFSVKFNFPPSYHSLSCSLPPKSPLGYYPPTAAPHSCVQATGCKAQRGSSPRHNSASRKTNIHTPFSGKQTLLI